MYCPKKTRQNCVAEKLNRTLVESDCLMLLKKFWAEAVSTALNMYLKNRCPTTAVQGKTPREVRHGVKPRVRVFGCDVHAYIPKDERRKFDTKARNYILLGYRKETKA